jgi:hypothetical protein
MFSTMADLSRGVFLARPATHSAARLRKSIVFRRFAILSFWRDDGSFHRVETRSRITLDLTFVILKGASSPYLRSSHEI